MKKLVRGEIEERMRQISNQGGTAMFYIVHPLLKKVTVGGVNLGRAEELRVLLDKAKSIANEEYNMPLKGHVNLPGITSGNASVSSRVHIKDATLRITGAEWGPLDNLRDTLMKVEDTARELGLDKISWTITKSGHAGNEVRLPTGDDLPSGWELKTKHRAPSGRSPGLTAHYVTRKLNAE